MRTAVLNIMSGNMIDIILYYFAVGLFVSGFGQWTVYNKFKKFSHPVGVFIDVILWPLALVTAIALWCGWGK